MLVKDPNLLNEVKKAIKPKRTLTRLLINHAMRRVKETFAEKDYSYSSTNDLYLIGSQVARVAKRTLEAIPKANLTPELVQDAIEEALDQIWKDLVEPDIQRGKPTPEIDENFVSHIASLLTEDPDVINEFIDHRGSRQIAKFCDLVGKQVNEGWGEEQSQGRYNCKKCGWSGENYDLKKDEETGKLRCPDCLEVEKSESDECPECDGDDPKCPECTMYHEKKDWERERF